MFAFVGNVMANGQSKSCAQQSRTDRLSTELTAQCAILTFDLKHWSGYVMNAISELMEVVASFVVHLEYRTLIIVVSARWLCLSILLIMAVVLADSGMHEIRKR